jgi:phage gp29-like protein
MAERTLLDRYGNPVNRAELAKPVEAPTIGSIRAPLAGYPGDGLTPLRLASILRAADMGDPIRYLELAEQIEERNPHYLAVLSTRKRSVSQLDISVEAASEAAEDVKRADMIREWLKRDELAEELFYLLDCLGKGYSFTAIHWAKSGGQWWPERLDQCDPRGFRFDRRDLTTPMLINDRGIEEPLDPFRYIYAQIMAKSGLPMRGGLARIAAWGWMFKAYTERDWAIFTQTYGQPLRVGKYDAQASEADRDKLFQAVAGIAGDCAAIIPDNMVIDFVETKNAGTSSDLYLKRADWLDQQISKAVLGQTATTDAIAGGHAVGQEHRQVQEDIERADARALAAILNRDLIRPWMELEYGKLDRYPRVVIARPEAEDLSLLSKSLAALLPFGLKVSASEIRDKFGLSEPKAGEELLMNPPKSDGMPPESAVKHRFNTPLAQPGASALQSVQRPSDGLNPPSASGAREDGTDPLPDQAAVMADAARPAVRRTMDRIEAMMTAAQSFDEFREMLLNGFDEAEARALGEAMAPGFLAADLAGRVEVLGEDHDG